MSSCKSSLCSLQVLVFNFSFELFALNRCCNSSKHSWTILECSTLAKACTCQIFMVCIISFIFILHIYNSYRVCTISNVYFIVMIQMCNFSQIFESPAFPVVIISNCWIYLFKFATSRVQIYMAVCFLYFFKKRIFDPLIIFSLSFSHENWLVSYRCIIRLIIKIEKPMPSP